MIVYYTRYNVKESFGNEELLEMVFECVSGMRNAPDSFKNLKWDGSESYEKNEDKNILAYEIDSETNCIAIRVAIIDENCELWTTDIALNGEKHEIQLRLARERRHVLAEYNKDFRLPYIFKRLIRDEKGGMDNDLPVSDTVIFVDESNINTVIDIIKQKKRYALPVIYVSHPFEKDEYELDVFELAKDMAGSAHVIVEKASASSAILKDVTDGENAYNGAVDVFYSDDSFRYLRRPDTTPNQFRYKIARAIFSRMAMRNIDDEGSLSAIKIRNKMKKIQLSSEKSQMLAMEIEDLKEKRKTDEEILEGASEELKQNEKRINELENENYNLENKVKTLMNSLNLKRSNGERVIEMNYSEEQFYEDEIKRFIMCCIKQTIDQYGEDERLRRDYHILKDIYDNNSVSEIGEEIKKKIFSVLKKDGVSELKSLGFELQKGSHDKYIFNNDDRYIITVPKTPSDYRNGNNIAHEAINLLFGRS